MIDKLLEERGKTHGDHKRVYSLVWRLWEETINTIAFKNLAPWQKVELLMVLLKTGRAVHNPTHADHFDDIGGYAELAKDE